jgi:tetrathionate reductase subunit B
MERNNELKSSRRDFLKVAGISIGGILAANLLQPFTAAVYASKEPKKEGPWYGIGIDIAKCIGCGSCARSCKKENDVPEVPFYFRSWVEQYTIKNDGEIKVESPNGGIDGFQQSIPDDEIFKTFFVPKMCNHCSKSPCVQVCPVGATFETEDGIVLVDKNYCIGCRYCIDKCTLCYHRVKKGYEPACMDICPTNARIFGDLRDKEGTLVKFLREHNCLVLKPHLNTGSKLFYNDLNMEVR